MAGLTTPVLATLGTVRTVKSAARTLGLDGGDDDGDERRRREDDLLDYRQAVELSQLRAAQDLEAETRRTDAERRARQIAVEAQAAETRRQRSLRRAVGRQRAKLGGQGISAADGSGEAILLGLVREAAEEDATARSLDALRLKALDDEARAAYRRNLLDLSELTERQRLQRLARGYS
ncbi:hypothetical protein [Rhodospirillum centenum]|uniref:Uncharacterized protein n=1 Tax=Rhodospirillum centenum (strain ATCC 51521 / SW) TaxID=414684 RepID=B6IW03_RHOCS|nr:hypothetical protein [Rhodospirillum centenum]ACJ00477.1 hypothetical protein RC1_3112 [Rhodospirillum centenum SW]